MAPFMGPDKQTDLKQLRSFLPKRHVPITLGRSAPQAVIENTGDVWVLVPLVVNREAANKAAHEANAAGRGWMPEMEFQFLERGEPLLEAQSAAELADLIEATDWTWS